jgi:DNA-binding Lrp family transcriptional regulator
VSWELTGLVSSKVIGSPVKRLVLLTMASRANDDGTGIYASLQTMARDCELSRATVKRAIKDLEEAGLVKQVGTRPCANGHTNDYSISVRRITALPDIKKNRGQAEPGAERTGVTKTNRGQAEPGSQCEPGSERPPTRVTVTPKPILEPSVVVVAKGAGDFKLMVKEAQARAGAACNLTSGHVHHVADLRRLIDAGCDWEADVLPAIDALSAGIIARKAKPINSWAHPGLIDAATTLRDRRLAGLPAPTKPTERTNGRSSAERDAWDSVLSEMEGDAAARTRAPVALGGS